MKDIKKENSFSKYRVAALIPCLNEEATIESTINNIRTNVPNVHVCVCDNGSKDNTIYRAKKSGAFIITESKKGKGAAVDRLFQSVEADIYIMVD